MDYQFIREKVLDLIIKCDIKTFPINCEEIVNMLGYKVYRYSELTYKKWMSCLLVSDVSFKYLDTIYCNDEMSIGRYRFSIMHELGHIILGHGEYRNAEYEKQADYFASCILIPRMVLHYARCNSVNEISKIFIVSRSAANVIYQDYCKWISLIQKNKMSLIDKKMYRHFYNNEYKGFVYKIGKCSCGQSIYNSQIDSCQSCLKTREKLRYYYSTYNNFGFL